MKRTHQRIALAVACSERVTAMLADVVKHAHVLAIAHDEERYAFDIDGVHAPALDRDLRIRYPSP